LKRGGAAAISRFGLENMHALAVQFKDRLEGFEFIEHPVRLREPSDEGVVVKIETQQFLGRDSRNLGGIVTDDRYALCGHLGRMVEKDDRRAAEVSGPQFRVAAIRLHNAPHSLPEIQKIRSLACGCVAVDHLKTPPACVGELVHALEFVLPALQAGGSENQNRFHDCHDKRQSTETQESIRKSMQNNFAQV